MYYFLGRFRESEKSYRRAVAILEPGIRGSPNAAPRPGPAAPALERHRSFSPGSRSISPWHGLGSTLEALGRRPEAEAAYRRALETSKARVAESPGDPSARRTLADDHYELGSFLAKTGRPEAGEQLSREGIAIAAQLAADFPRIPDFRLALARAHCNMGGLLLQRRRPADAEEAFRQALDQSQKLTAEFPQRPGNWMILIGSYTELGNLLASRSRGAEADVLYQRATETYEKLPPNMVTDPWVVACTVRCYLSRGTSLWAAGRRTEAEDCYRKGLEVVSKRAAVGEDNPNSRRGIANLYVEFSDAFKKAGLTEKAEAAYHSHRAIVDKLAADFPKEPLYRSDQIWVRNVLGRLLEAAGRPKETEAMFAQALALAEKLVADFPEAGHRPRLAGVHSERGHFYSRAGRYREAAADFAAATQQNPDDAYAWYLGGLARVAAADRDGYRKTCAGMVERFGQSPDASAGYWTAWTCILVPDAVPNASLPVQLAEQALAADPKNCDRLNALGAALHRAGRFEDAAKRLAEAEAAFKEAKAPRGTSTYTRLFQAMTQHRLGHKQEATQKFEQAVKDIDQPAPDKAADANATSWNRRLTLRLFRREAEDLLKGDSGIKRE